MAPKKSSADQQEDNSTKKPLKDDDEESDGALEVFLPTPPDGGWGWVIVGASLLANIIVDGITYTFGIFLPKFEEAFQQPKRTVALAGSLQVGTYLCAGPIVSALTNRYGCKAVTMVGSVVATIGFILSVFAPTADILILTYGIIGGFGFGMMYLPAIVIVGYYFEKRRALATGIAVCGSGIGMFILAPVTDILLNEFGHRGALLILAGFVFNGVLCGALMRPLPLPGQDDDDDSDSEDSGRGSPLLGKPGEATDNGKDDNDTKKSSTKSPIYKPSAQKNKDSSKEGSSEEAKSRKISVGESSGEPKSRKISVGESSGEPKSRKISVGELNRKIDTGEIPGLTVLDSGKKPHHHHHHHGGPLQSFLASEGVVKGKKGNEGGGAAAGLSSSVPDVLYSSARKARGGAGGGAGVRGYRQRSNTLDPAERIRLRHVLPKQHHQDELPKRHMTPIGLSYIGVSDAHLNKVRASTKLLALSRREIGVGSGMLFISDHNVHQSHLRSAISIKSHKSVLSEREKVLCSCLPESARDTLLQMLDFTILKNKAYDLILLGNIFAMLGFYVPFVFMPQKAQEQGVSDAQAAFLLSIIGITNTVGRVLTGVLANMNKIDSLVINNIAMLICGIATFVTPFCNNYILLCFIAAVFGLCVAAYISLSSILLCDMLGVEQLTNAFGFLTLARGVSSCAGSPMAGAIIDSTKNIDLAFYVGGVLIVVGSLCHFMLHTPCINHKGMVQAQANSNKRKEDMEMA